MSIKTYNTDCIKFMNNHKDFIDLILTSPPYNMTKRKGGDADTNRYDEYNDWKKPKEFIFIFVRKDEIKSFTTNKQISKVSPTNQTYYYPIKNFIEAKNNDKQTKSINQATFSTDLVMKLLTIYAKPNKDFIVYDSFLGTGTTAIGCIKYGCSFLGTEISEKQFDYTNNRINKELKEVGLFNG